MDWFLYDGDLAAFQFNRRMFVKFVRYITHSERNKTDTKQLIRNERFMQLQYRLLFFLLFPWKQNSSSVKKSKFVNEYWQSRKVFILH